METFVAAIASATADPSDLGAVDDRAAAAADRRHARQRAKARRTGIPHHGRIVSLAVEFKDHLVVLEADESRSARSRHHR